MAEKKPDLIERLSNALSVANKAGDRYKEGRVYCNLGVAYQRLGKLQEAKECHKNDLSIAKEIGDKAAEGRAYCNLGIVYTELGNFQEAKKCHIEHLSIAVEMGDKVKEGLASGNLGNVFLRLGKFTEAKEHFEKRLTIAKEVNDIVGEGRAYASLGNLYQSLGRFKEAIDYHQKDLSIAEKLADGTGEQRANANLANAYASLGRFKDAIEYHTKDLSIAKERNNRAAEGRAYGNLGNAYNDLGDFEKAVECHEKRLTIAKELGQRDAEGRACGNLGNAYNDLGNFEKAMEYHKKHLSIAVEVGDRAEEGRAYSNFGNFYQSRGNFQEAVNYHQKALFIAKEVGDRAGEGRAYCNLGIAFRCLGRFVDAIQKYNEYLSIVQEAGDRNGEGRAYGNLGSVYASLGNFQKAIENYEKRLSIAKDVGDEAGEGRCHGNLGSAYDMLGQRDEAMKHFDKRLSIAKKLGDKPGEGLAYGHLGNAWQKLGDFEEAKRCHEKHLSIANLVGDKAGEGQAYANLGGAYQNLKEFEKAIEYYNKSLLIAREVGDKVGEGTAYGNLGDAYSNRDDYQKAAECYQLSVDLFDGIRAGLEYEDAWKISFQDLYRANYSALWRTLLNLQKIDEALYAAEQGRAQTLVDNLRVQYNLAEPPAASTLSRQTISYLSNTLTTQTVFLGLEPRKISFWVISHGNKVDFRQKEIEGGDPEDYFVVLLQSVLKNIKAGKSVRCEDRSLDEDTLRNDEPVSNSEDDGKQAEPSQANKDALQPLYDAIIGPIADLLQGDELIIVPDGPFALAPLAALSESIRIRTVPSLTILKLIMEAPKESYNETGVLLVGDPCLQDVKKLKKKPLKYAKEEVERIGEILKIPPLTGTEATKNEVLRRMSSVALVHIAAHGRPETGEISLAPNPGWREKQRGISKPKKTEPTDEDYLLTISDVQAAHLRAKLVVLSCCHSGRGEVKSEGVMGIARAFLAAGARSVLMSLWGISDKATLEFMTIFYQHLAEGKSSSVGLHQAMKFLRESGDQKLSAVRNWAPFVLIGDDVTLEFGEKGRCKWTLLRYLVTI